VSTILFGVWPYLAGAVCLVGHVWRWRFDQFGWTSRTSQLMEKRWLAIGSPLFHLGALMVIGGHALGLLVPASATRAVGLSDHAYHLVAVGGGVAAGAVFAAGAVILTIRRFLSRARFRLSNRPADLVMYALLGITAGFGLGGTLVLNAFGQGYDYRPTIAVWFRGLFVLDPRPELMAAAPWPYQVHVLAALALIAWWPFTRLVHVWSVPLGYLIRPPIVYRRPPS
jgi:nitrate reductase gamma subunit